MSDAELALLAKAQIVAHLDQLVRETENRPYRAVLLQQRNRVAKLLDQPGKALKDYQERKSSSASDLAAAEEPS